MPDPEPDPDPIHDPRRSYLAYQGTVLAIQTGSRMLSLAVGWSIYNHTGRTMDVGLVGLVQFLPALLMAPFTGQAADRLDRRTVVVVCALALAVCYGALFYLGAGGAVRLGPLYVLLGVISVTLSFYYPAVTALLPAQVPEARFPGAVAWISSLKQISTVCGPAAGGVIYAATGSAGGVYLTCMAAAVLAFLSALHLKRSPPERSAPVEGSSLVAGFRHVWRDKTLLGSITLDLFAVLLGGATALLPAVARNVLHVGPAALGVLRSLPAAGAFVLALWLSRRPLQRATGKVTLAAVVLFGVSTIVFGLTRNLYIAGAALFAMGTCDIVSGVTRQTLVQLKTPPEMRGRVSAVSQMSIVASNQLGEFESGLTADLFGLAPAIILGGCGSILIAVAWARLFPSLRRLKRLAPEPERQPAYRPELAAAAGMS